ncbi:family 43 glycosylhydrolase [Paenibacillus sedimenti]|uniref:Family 43 glycosylhydrolase n=1 Tax=Paenibacillus sedimenti TaxID=2770274 RepID=A0A926QHQ6_9BACL|nr:family 43 glycosylhydrolase [Paenibacillus sedimenti]MBD0378774.1 family 43 glycosylhydrolase [Paenibacillus sedimenti]
MKRRILFLVMMISFVLILASCREEGPQRMDMKKWSQSATYSNPMELAEEWDEYGIGDPFVLRYNGMYYLYCSTRDDQIGVKAWSSADLANWKPEGLVTEEPLTQGAYAPEVVYWNGYFYMYTSPGGGGHYVLRSDSPTGPFKIQTENLGMTIDGSVFVDDDGKWYFTRASDRGIVAHEMTDPYTFGSARLIPEAYMQHWTEGSMIWKRHGKYLMTYTGNHVFSTGYRIQYSISDKGTLGPYRTPKNNPFVISTDDAFNGLGHSSTVLGPDLDSYYLVYHNLIGASTKGPPIRMLNIDRLQFNGDRMSLLGPTYDMNRPAARMPDFASKEVLPGTTAGWKQEQMKGMTFVVSESETDPTFTAEYNFRAMAAGGASPSMGVVFAYENGKNYMFAGVNGNHELTLHAVKDGNASLLSKAQLPNETDLSKLHTVRVECYDGAIHVYWDQMHKIEADTQVRGGKIGYLYDISAVPAILFTAYSNDAGGSSDHETVKPIPGNIEAVHHLKDKGRGYSDAGSDDKRVTDDGSRSAELPNADDWLQYHVQVKKAGTYGIDMDLLPVEDETTIEIAAGGEKQQFVLQGRGHTDSKWERIRIGSMELQEGYAGLKVSVLRGSLSFRTMTFYSSGEAFTPIENVPKRMVGMWIPVDGGYETRSHEYIKTFAGSEDWTDYRMDAEFHYPTDPTSDAGLLIRSVHESYYPHQVHDAFTGYYASVDQDGLSLKKVNYGKQEVLQSVPLDIQKEVAYRMSVEVSGNRIRVYWNGSPDPVIDYFDPRAYTHGKIGLLSNHSDIIFHQVRLQ